MHNKERKEKDSERISKNTLGVIAILPIYLFIYLWEKKPEIPLKMRKVNGLLWGEKGEEEQ